MSYRGHWLADRWNSVSLTYSALSSWKGLYSRFCFTDLELLYYLCVAERSQWTVLIKAQIKIRWYSEYTFAAYMNFPKQFSQNNPVCTDCTWEAESVEVCNMIFGSTWLAINPCICVVFNEWNKYKEANKRTYFSRTHNPSFVMQFLTNLYI